MNSLSYLSRQYDVLASSQSRRPQSSSNPKSLGRRRKYLRNPQHFLVTRVGAKLWTFVHARWLVWLYMRKMVADSQDLDDDTAVEEEDEEEEGNAKLQDITEEGEGAEDEPKTLQKRSKKKQSVQPLASSGSTSSTITLYQTSSGASISPCSSIEVIPITNLEPPQLDFTPPTPQSVPLPLPQTLRLNPYANSLLTTHPNPPSRSKSSTTTNQHNLYIQSSPSSSRPLTPRPQQNPSSMLVPMTLVLDLDETLIHSTSKAPQGYNSQGQGLFSAGGLGFGMTGLGSGMWGGGKRSLAPAHMVEVVLGGRSTLYHVYKRPFVDYFLRKVSSWYTVVIFTASMQEYADPVIDWLDAGRGILGRRFFRESCTQLPNGTYSKDLTLIESDLSRVALLDNSPISYSNFPANGIPIEGWISDPSDEALLDLLPILDSLRFTTDVRKVLGLRGFGYS